MAAPIAPVTVSAAAASPAVQALAPETALKTCACAE